LVTVTTEADDVRAIEQLKARYCRLLDAKDWDAFRELFAADFVSDTSGAGGIRIEGEDAFVKFVRRTLTGAISVHQVQHHEIELTSPTSATGVWAMQDVVRFRPGLTLNGFGYYNESYAKVDGAWLIQSLTLTRLREDLRTPFFSLFVSDRLRRRLGQAAAKRFAKARREEQNG
jgi:hypothetical protein